MEVLRQFTRLTHLSPVIHADTHPITTDNSYVNLQAGLERMASSDAVLELKDTESGFGNLYQKAGFGQMETSTLCVQWTMIQTGQNMKMKP
jgi:hypothetical protein